MYTHVWTAALSGVDALPVKVECHAAKGLPKILITGLPDSAIREAVPRVLSAARLSGFKLKLEQRVVVNLVPGDLRKSGSSFDLPIALGMLGAMELIPQELLRDTLVLGELSLDGRIEAVRGVLSLVQAAREEGFSRIMVPAENREEALAGTRLPVAAPGSLREAILALGSPGAWEMERPGQELRGQSSSNMDLKVVRGQTLARRALEIAAAGGHNLLMVGSPGSGKTLLARCMPGILPPMNHSEQLEASRIHSVAGLLPARRGLLEGRPFRAPHATISDAGLIGSGRPPHVGEISLAHHGVLFLDELPQFRRTVLEQLRQPLEDGHVLVSRASLRLELPSRFCLLAAMNPCPCGMYGDPRRECGCSPLERQRYLARLSGPVLDRIDLQVQVASLDQTELLGAHAAEDSATVATRVLGAHQRQLARNKALTAGRTLPNAALSGPLARQACPLEPASRRLLEKAITQNQLSGRSLDRVFKVARTVADLAGREEVLSQDLAEALLLRTGRLVPEDAFA
jgi:magnesium chelatase family protein